MWSLVFQSLRKFPCQLFKIKWNSNSVPHKKFRATALQITYFLWHPVASCVQFIISPAALFISLLAPTNNAACVIYWQILANNLSMVQILNMAAVKHANWVFGLQIVGRSIPDCKYSPAIIEWLKVRKVQWTSLTWYPIFGSCQCTSTFMSPPSHGFRKNLQLIISSISVWTTKKYTLDAWVNTQS